MSDATVTTEAAPEPRGPYPHVRIDGDHVWVTGQIGRDPAGGDFVTGGRSSPSSSTNGPITNLAQILAERGGLLAWRRGADLRAVHRRGRPGLP